MSDAYPAAIGVCLNAKAIWLNKFPRGERCDVAATVA